MVVGVCIEILQADEETPSEPSLKRTRVLFVQNGSWMGQFGAMGCFSFYPAKNLGAYGEGGALVTNDGFAARARALHDHAQSRRFYHDEIGHNY
jgi:dTDP-4-amino-4,6-dideoxygalactose transaminase